MHLRPHRRRRTALAAAAAVVAGALAVPAASAAPQQAPERAAMSAKPKPKAKPEDFNGDGYRDVVVSAPGAFLKGKQRAGAVVVSYGSASGSPTARTQVIDQDTPGVPDEVELADSFGTSPVTGDLDQDGYTDLIVGTVDEDPPVRPGPVLYDTGLLTVVWGGPRGLSGGAELWRGEHPYDEVGSATTAGDFDGDGDVDLVTVVSGTERETLRMLSGPFGRDGSATAETLLDDPGQEVRYGRIAAGDVNGDRRADLVHTRSVTGPGARTEVSVRLGGDGGPGPVRFLRKLPHLVVDDFTVAVGDTTADGRADVVVGVFGRHYSAGLVEKGGTVVWIPGSRTGPDVSKTRTFTQDTPGVPGSAETYDQFGSAVAIGDADGDGDGEIAVGVQSESIDGVSRTGSAVVLPGTKSGPTGKGAKVFSQGAPGVPGTNEPGDQFGSAVKFTDRNGDRRSELLVGGIGENTYTGSLWVFPATASGITVKGSRNIGQSAFGLKPHARNTFAAYFNE